MKWWMPFAAFLWGLPVAWAFGKYMIEVAARRSARAAGWDLMIMLMANVTFMAWLESGEHVVLVGYSLGNATGTYLVTRWSR